MDCDEYHADMSTSASTVSQGTPDVYVLPLTEVSLPTTKQPARSGESKFGSLSSRPPKLLQRASLSCKVRTSCASAALTLMDDDDDWEDECVVEQYLIMISLMMQA